jgi:hypothetical protein
MNEDALLKEVKGALEVWHGMAVKLHTTVIIFGGLATISSLGLTAFVGTSWMTETLIRVLSFLSKLFLTLLTIFSVSSKGNNARRAWRHLNYALLLFYSGKLSLEDLAKAKSEGEEILGTVDFNPNLLRETTASDKQ